MKWKQVDCIITTGLLGAAGLCWVHYIWGTIIGAIFGIWVGTRCEEYRAAKNKTAQKPIAQQPRA